MKKNSKILVLGKNGLLGSSVLKLLIETEHVNLISPVSKELNLLNKIDTEKFFSQHKPEYVFMLAGLVGGILINSKKQADFLYQNTTMILNVLESIKKYCSNAKLLYVGSTCIYPKNNPQPITENRFLAGKLEKTNIGYAIAKITGIVACQSYKDQYGIKTVCALPSNLYGVGDNYNPETSHFIAAMIRKFLMAKKNNDNEIKFWGTGLARREALFNDDCADVLIHLMRNYNSSEIVNVGTGIDYSIREFVSIMKRITNYSGTISWDENKPEGTFQKKCDMTKLRSIYSEFHPIKFEQGIERKLSNKKEVERILYS